MSKHWIAKGQALFEAARKPLPHEVNELDWKSSLSPNNNRLAEHLIAFANYPNGGYMVYGVEDRNAKLIGVEASDVSLIIAKLTNLARDAISPPLVLDHTVIEIEGVPLLFVRIPESMHKPVCQRGKSIEESWIRSGGSTRKASRPEIGALLTQSKQPCWEELRASSLLDAETVLKLLDLETIARLLQQPLPTSAVEQMNWLEHEKMVVPDGHGYYITNLGGIAVAHDLNQFESLARKTIRVIRYKGNNKVNTIDEEVMETGYAVGFEALIKHLNRILPHSEVIKQSLRARTTLYPEIALRELIANTLIHQDFSVTGTGPMIEIFDDRIEFTNPGGLLPSKQIDRLIGTKPESRNESLAWHCRRYHICEERGTGFQKVIEATELYCLPPIAFLQLENAFQVTLYAPRTFSEMTQQERIEACYQHAQLQYYSGRKALTNTTLRERLKVHDKQRNQITNLISEAVSAGRIKRKDKHSGCKFAEYYPYWA